MALDPDRIPRNDDVPLCGREILQYPSNRTSQLITIRKFDNRFESMDPNDASGERRLGSLNLDRLYAIAMLRIEQFPFDSSTACQIPFAGNALGVLSVYLVARIGILFGKPPFATLTLVPFAKFNPILA
jgi:hypothetical protein